MTEAAAHCAPPTTTARWPRFRSVQWPDFPGRTIDEVVLGASGVHVCLHVPVTDPAEPELRGWAADAAAAGEAVAALLPPRYSRAVRPSVCVCGGRDFGLADSRVPVVSPDCWQHLVSHAPRLLSTSEIAVVAGLLDQRLELVVPPPVAVLPRRWWRRLLRRAEPVRPR